MDNFYRLNGKFVKVIDIEGDYCVKYYDGQVRRIFFDVKEFFLIAKKVEDLSTIMLLHFTI